MRRPRNIFSLACIVIGVFAVADCMAKPQSSNRSGKTASESPLRAKLDPLGLPQDTVVVVTPNSDAEKNLIEEIRSISHVQSRPPGVSSQADSSGGQVYRVQLLTADNYSDARRALAVAEEIFDLSISLTYDQPYYKLRVGEFATKSDADAYLLKAKAAGYANGWVLLANVGVKELRPMYENAPPLESPDTTTNVHDKHD